MRRRARWSSQAAGANRGRTNQSERDRDGVAVVGRCSARSRVGHGVRALRALVDGRGPRFTVRRVTGPELRPLRRCYSRRASFGSTMPRGGELVEGVRRLHLPARSVRLRLTALYGGLSFVCGVGLLAVTYTLVRHATSTAPVVLSVDPARAKAIAAASHQSPAAVFTHLRALGPTAAIQRAVDLHHLLVEPGVGLAIMTVVAAVLGWLVAGRVLRPLRTMTVRTRRISEDNLHDRLALQGPRDELTELGDTIDGLLERLEVAFKRSGGLSPTPRTSCAPRWPRCGRRLTSRWPSRRCIRRTSSRSRTGFATSSITLSGCWRAFSARPSPTWTGDRRVHRPAGRHRFRGGRTPRRRHRPVGA